MRYDTDSGWWLPDDETHLTEWMGGRANRIDGRALYQRSKVNCALRLVPKRNRRVAVDVGAHVGTWSWQLAGWFERVEAFEPITEFRRCWTANMKGLESEARLHPWALGSEPGRVSFHDETGHSMRTRVDVTKNAGTHRIKTLDSMGLTQVDLLKVDCEGYEEEVIRGALMTILRWKPIVVVEQKPGNAEEYGLAATGAVDLLLTHGYETAEVMKGDYFMRPL